MINIGEGGILNNLIDHMYLNVADLSWVQDIDDWDNEMRGILHFAFWLIADEIL